MESMATPEPPDFKEVPPPPAYDPNKYIPSAANPESSFDEKGKFRGPRVSVSRTEGGTTVVTRDTDTATSYFKWVTIKQVANGWMVIREDNSVYAENGVWVFPTKADLAKFIVDKF
jgi:hypothetical protein